MTDEHTPPNPEAETPNPGQAPPLPPPPPSQADSQLSNDSRNMGMLCHLLAIFTGFIGPLIIWLIKKDEDPYVDFHGKQALNFQFTLLIFYIAGAITICITIGFFITLAAVVLHYVFTIIATVAANKGEYYRYPLAIPFFK